MAIVRIGDDEGSMKRVRVKSVKTLDIPPSDVLLEVVCGRRTGKPQPIVYVFPRGVVAGKLIVQTVRDHVAVGQDVPNLSCPCGAVHDINGELLRDRILSALEVARLRKAVQVEVSEVELPE